MLRPALVLVLAGCFTPQPGISKSRALAYNGLTIAGGVAAAALGYATFRATEDADGLGPFIGAMGLGAGVGGGAFMTLGGIFGIAFTYADLTPTHSHD